MFNKEELINEYIGLINFNKNFLNEDVKGDIYFHLQDLGISNINLLNEITIEIDKRIKEKGFKRICNRTSDIFLDDDFKIQTCYGSTYEKIKKIY